MEHFSRSSLLIRLQMTIERTIMTTRKSTKEPPMMMMDMSASATSVETGPDTLMLHLLPRPAMFLAWQENSPSIPSVISNWVAELKIAAVKGR